jgi:uncharacterized protein (TIGR03435 family)
MRTVRIYIRDQPPFRQARQPHASAWGYLLALIALTARSQSFEVASVKRTTEPAQNTITCLPGGERLRVKNMPLNWLIGAAYNMPVRQISGLLETFAKEDYDIEAKADHPVNRQQMMLLLRHLLEDRFKLAVRRETKEMKAQVLVVAKGGPKLDENGDGAELFQDRIGRNKWAFRNMPLALFVNAVANWIDDTVVDQTGLNGTYDFTVEFTPERIRQGGGEGGERAPDPNGPSIYTALQEQLGLKLESRKSLVEFLLVEHVERPAGN